VNRLYFISRNLKVQHRIRLAVLIRTDSAFLDQPVSGNDDEELPLAVVPMLTFGNSGLRDIDGELPVTSLEITVRFPMVIRL
jgi:hypothetical protein